MSKTPAHIILIYPQHYEIKEKEYILFFEAKKKYYLSLQTRNAQSFSETDSEYVDKMSVKDTSFVNYLDKHITHTLEFTTQDKCLNLITVWPRAPSATTSSGRASSPRTTF